jgi:hypothetical protein
VRVHGNVDATADEEVKRIVTGGLASDDTPKSIASLVEIPVEIAVSSAEQGLDKWFEMRKAEFYDRTNVVGEHVRCYKCSRKGARSERLPASWGFPRTVRFHKLRITEELGISKNTELVKYAMKHGMISPA